MIRSLGAADVIDFTRDDFTRDHGDYHLIFDVVGNHSFRRCRRALTPDGSYVLIGHDGFGDAAGPINFSLPDRKDSMADLRGHLEAGELTPAIDRVFSLDEVPEAMRYLQTGQALGKIIIAI